MVSVLSPEEKLSPLAHRVEGLQRGRPLHADDGLRSARGARGGGADPRGGG